MCRFACEHRCLFGLSETENTSEICTDPTTASGGDSHCPAQAFQGACADCPVLPSCLLPSEVFISGSEMKKLAYARRARLSLQDGFCLRSLISSRSVQLVFPNSRSQCFPWTKDNVRQSLLQISVLYLIMKECRMVFRRWLLP